MSYDVCVVGAGAAGITIALEILNGRHKVLVVESGGLQPETATTDLYRSEFSGMSHLGTHTGRARVFGGTTTLWGGQALPLYPIDFEARPWVEYSGWPIGFPELAPYYPRAMKVMQVAGAPFDEERLRALGGKVPAFDPARINLVCSQWSPRPNFAQVYGDTFRRSQSVDVLLHANGVEIVPNSSASAIEQLEIRSLKGRQGVVKARCYVICCGGIETARLLLASRRVEPNGVGNRHDLVGRFFQDHLAVKCGWIQPISRCRLQNIIDQYHRNGIKFLPKLLAAESFQRENRTLNMIANVCFAWPEDSALPAVKRFVGGIVRGRRTTIDASTIAHSMFELVQMFRAAWRYTVKRRSFSPRRGAIYLEAHCEQEPNLESRIRLGSDCDALGMPRPVVQWKPTQLSWRSVTVFAQTIAVEFKRLGLGRIELILPPLGDDLAWRKSVSDMFHHMGTTRMSDSPKRGVVDPRCRVHGYDNLYIGSSAVFPTGGCSNPTLTMMALCARIAEELKTRLQ